MYIHTNAHQYPSAIYRRTVKPSFSASGDMGGPALASAAGVPLSLIFAQMCKEQTRAFDGEGCGQLVK